MPSYSPAPSNDDIVGLNIIYKTAGVPGTSLNGIAPPGALCIDYTNFNLYINAGTKATNSWKLITRAA